MAAATLPLAGPLGDRSGQRSHPGYLQDLLTQAEALWERANGDGPGEASRARLCDEAHRLEAKIALAPARGLGDAAAKLKLLRHHETSDAISDFTGAALDSALAILEA